MSNAEPGLCQSCWTGRGVEKVKGADGKLRWRCAKCLAERKKYIKKRLAARPSEAV